MEGDYKAATIYEARPYIPGCNSSMSPGKNLGNESYDITKLYSQPAARAAHRYCVHRAGRRSRKQR